MKLPRRGCKKLARPFFLLPCHWPSPHLHIGTPPDFQVVATCAGNYGEILWKKQILGLDRVWMPERQRYWKGNTLVSFFLRDMLAAETQLRFFNGETMIIIVVWIKGLAKRDIYEGSVIVCTFFLMRCPKCNKGQGQSRLSLYVRRLSCDYCRIIGESCRNNAVRIVIAVADF